VYIVCGLVCVGQSEDANHLRTVQLEHDLSGSLGISVAGGVGSPLGDVPVIIAHLNPDGPAARSGKLRVSESLIDTVII
jgi:multiple PDZ domain protein